MWRSQDATPTSYMTLNYAPGGLPHSESGHGWAQALVRATYDRKETIPVGEQYGRA